MDPTSSPESSTRGPKSTPVLSVNCIGGSSEEWTGEMLQTGDIVEEFRIGSGSSFKAPFKNGNSGVQKILHKSFKSKETSIVVRVRSGNREFAELQACIVPELGRKKQYILRSIEDPNYAVGFSDRSEAECLELQGAGSRSSRLVNALSSAKLHDGYVPYPWQKKMQELLPVPNLSCFLSILFLPKASDHNDSQYNDLEDTLARANSWLYASQASGVPAVFMNIQTESLLTKISGDTASSTVNAGSLSDLSNLAYASLYGFEDYHGVDIGVVRAVRLWYAPLCGEFPIEIEIKEGDLKLGFAISRTEEGFIYIQSVLDGDDNVPSARSGLSKLYKQATTASKLLVVSRISNKKILPWIVSSTGTIRCFDTVSLSQKLSLHRHAKVPICIHVFLWDQTLVSNSEGSGMHSSVPVSGSSSSLETQLVKHTNGSQATDLQLEGGTAGDGSFRFHDFALPNWV